MFTISSVISDLYIGNIDSLDPNILRKHNISAIISILSPETPTVYPHGINVIRISIDDSEHENIDSWLELTYQFIHSHLKSKKKVLVHCYAGISRSATVVLYYLMKTFKVPLSTAFGYLRSRRYIINPNPGFIRTLSKYSWHWYGTI
jgi:protein-tyrosine phosphatase